MQRTSSVEAWGPPVRKEALALSKAVMVAATVALGLGLTIGAQATLVNRSGRLVGPVRTGLLLNAGAGMLAGLVLLSLTVVRGSFPIKLSREIILIMAIASVVNIVSISTYTFVLGQIGVSATMTAVILGQISVGAIVDTLGTGGIEPTPLDVRRVAGLAIMGMAVFLLLPRS